MLPILCLLLLAAPANDDNITIVKAKPTVEYKTFDPAKPPDPAPPLEPGEAAVCTYYFSVHANVRYNSQTLPGAAKTSITIASVSVNLGLQVTVWLPKNAGERLKTHEETHRKIAEAFYDQAEQYARPHAQKLLGRQFTVPAATLKKSTDDVLDLLVKQFCDQYVGAINTPTAKAQKLLDELTDHARKPAPTDEDAMRQAIKEATQ